MIASRPLRSILHQISTIRAYGLCPAAIVLDRASYTQTLEDIAARDGLEHLDAISAIEGVTIAIVAAPSMCEVVPDAQQQWEIGDEMDRVLAEERPTTEPRFAEL